MRPWADEEGPGSAPDEKAPRPGLLRAARTAGRGYFENFALLAVLNLLLVLAALMVAAGFSIFRPAILLAPLVALPASALMRVAVEVARRRGPTWAGALAEVRRRAGRKLLLAAAQLLVAAVGLLNLALAAAIAGWAGMGAAAIGAYGLVISSAYALALWPIVCDPHRDGPLAGQLQLALAVMVLRPLQLAALLAAAAASVTASVLFIVPLIILPALVVLLIGAYVVPAADLIEPTGTR